MTNGRITEICEGGASVISVIDQGPGSMDAENLCEASVLNSGSARKEKEKTPSLTSGELGGRPWEKFKTKNR